MIERYAGETAFGSEVELDVSVRLAGSQRRANPIYDLVVNTYISGAAFETRFGESYGYIGGRRLDDLIACSTLNTTSAILKKYFQQRTPNLYATFVESVKEIQIHRIESQAIAPGQKFCERTLKQLLNVTPDVTSIFFDYVTNIRTRDIILPVLKGDRDISSIESSEHGSALVSALISMGFSDIFIVRHGVKEFGIRGFHSREVTWSLLNRPAFGGGPIL